MTDLCDLFVIGGGVNGCGIARDAAGRGLSVVLAEKGDLAGATSSASSKLIHGGLRYLEQYEFKLVREALQEREVLLKAAPHIIWPLRFVLPHDSDQRPAWMIQLGLFLYDHLAKREALPGSERIDLSRRADYAAPLKNGITNAFDYADCWVDDARLVALNARAAAEAGARIETRMAVTRAERVGAEWRITTLAADGGERLFRARALVNAAGPWVGRMFDGVIDRPAPAKVRLIRGSHIVLPRLYAGNHAYILQNDDKRVIFTIPYEGSFTLVGTTDVDQQGDPSAARISPDEIAYLCRAVGRWFKDTPQPSDIVWSYAGVRPLYDDGAGAASTVTRDYVLTLDAADGAAPLLSVFGGKITTFRRLAEDAMAKLAKPLGLAAPAWTARACLPGGDLPNGDREAFIADCARRWSALPAGLVRRYAGAYGTRIERLLADCSTVKDLGEPFDAEIYEAELSYLADQEWARTAEDMLWRRTKLGLRCRRDAPARIAAWFAAR